jgi:tRNA (mo5U34)-methyltransferase
MPLSYRLYLRLWRWIVLARRWLRNPIGVWIAEGDAARDSKYWRRAARCYRRALRHDPQMAPIWIQLGHAMKEHGALADADAAYRRASALAPRDADAHLQLGHLKMVQGDPVAAGALYREALRRDRSLHDAADALRALGLMPDLRDEACAPLPLSEEVAEHYWWHSIDLGNGLVTPGRKSLRQMASEFGNTFGPLDLDGRSVLDVGAWNGGFSVEAMRRGAARVVALDHYTWNTRPYRGRETFDLVSRVTGLDLEAVDIDLDTPQLSLAGLGHFDVVLFLGVFYHLVDPIAALREVAALTNEVLVVETFIERRLNPRPSMMFYPGNERAMDASNWWGPNTACMLELLRHAGFARVETRRGSNRTRKVFHAFRR